jgi:hypothetical protein
MPNKKTSKKKFIIIGIIILVIICAGITAYIIYTNSHNARHFNSIYQHRGNFTFDNATLIQVTSFLNSNTNTQSMISYCQQSINILYCRYYCMKVNPSNSVCDQLPTPKYRMNYTGVPTQ